MAGALSTCDMLEGFLNPVTMVRTTHYLFLMNDIYTHTVPLFVKHLGGLKNILDKAEQHANEKGLDVAAILSDRLAPDMFDCTRQIQIACDNAKGAVSRLTAIEAPKFDDTEKTIAELKSRIDKTLEFVQSVPETAFADAATRQVVLPYFPGTYMTGEDYAREYVISNFLFHVTVAYGIFRHNGVPLGKADFMNGLPLKPIA